MRGLQFATILVQRKNRWVAPILRGLDCPMAAFLGNNDTLIPRSCWALWSEQAGGHFESHFYPGTHFFSAEGQGMMITRIVEMITEAMVQHIELAACANHRGVKYVISTLSNPAAGRI
jgi:hypothetical protein